LLNTLGEGDEEVVEEQQSQGKSKGPFMEEKLTDLLWICYERPGAELLHVTNDDVTSAKVSRFLARSERGRFASLRLIIDHFMFACGGATCMFLFPGCLFQ
jgi:hypothetical protein